MTFETVLIHGSIVLQTAVAAGFITCCLRFRSPAFAFIAIGSALRVFHRICALIPALVAIEHAYLPVVLSIVDGIGIYLLLHHHPVVAHQKSRHAEQGQDGS